MGLGIAPTPVLFPEEELAVRFTARLRLFAARKLNDAVAAQDVAQETLRVVVEAIRAGQIQGAEALPGFVFQTARNLCMHWVRSAAREKTAFARLERDSIDSSTVLDALMSVISLERAQGVRDAIGRLAKDDRALLHMFYYETLATDVIAARVGLNSAAVRVRKHRALQRLAAQLDEST